MFGPPDRGPRVALLTSVAFRRISRENKWMLKHHRFHSIRTLRKTVLASLVVSAASGVLSVWLTRELAKANDTQSELGLTRVEAVSLYAQGLQMSQATRNILLAPTIQTAYANHDTAVKEFESTLRALRERVESLFPGSDSLAALSSIGADFRAHVDIQHQIHELARRGDFENGKRLLNSADTPLWRKYKQSILNFDKWLEERAVQTSLTILRKSHLAQWLSWLSGLLLVLASLSAFAASGGVNRKLTELGGLLLAGAKQIASAARQVSTSSELLAHGASAQAASLEETTASGEEINAVARRNTENSRTASKLAAHSQELFTGANLLLNESVAVIGEINGSSDKISKIIRVIDDIAFETNILALNAAVEAARAGVTGAGFSVVADEVRNLAQRCAQAARETASLIEGSIAKSRDGKVKVDQVAESIRNITPETARIRTLVEEVMVGSTEQARGIEQVSAALRRIEQVTQTTAASAEESAAAAEELSAQSATLEEVVEHLSAVIGT
jgi:methyl-accepting chemotaxis protein/methyl-accepting chemotaxis protein-1 (serine sensor receptor)